ncbi:phage portal protein [Sciscionella sediminilitoris]|uniref:phage portal protein n=1 Tax=Sciscionella sediminilitoris TaxID=1445613 RepID=UPI0018D08A1F|nr:phage portal protein [Sciscionella sp. SE31]
MLDRLHPLGFRTGAVSDETGDEAAWRIWQANSLDYWSTLLFDAALTMRDGYTMVGPPVDGIPRITVEDPRQVITEEDPTTGKPIAGVKLWHDDLDELDRAVVQLPGLVVHYRATNKTRWRGLGVVSPNGWEIDESPSGRVPIDEVLITRFANRRDLLGASMAEFEGNAIDIQDRLDRETFDRMVIAAVQAFKQRWVKGDIPKVDADGKPIDLNAVLRSGPDALWALRGAVEFGEFDSVDLTPILKANESDVMAMAKTSRTPAQHMLGGDLVNIGADAYTASLDTFLAKCEQRIRAFQDPLERTMALAFRVIGDDRRADLHDMEAMFASAQRFTLSERSDAAVKMVGILAKRTIKRDILQMSPQAIARDEADAAADLLDAALNGDGNGATSSGAVGGPDDRGSAEPAENDDRGIAADTGEPRRG